MDHEDRMSSLKERLSIALPVLFAIFLLMAVLTVSNAAQAQETIPVDTGIRIQIRPVIHMKGGGAANGGRSCFNPGSALKLHRSMVRNNPGSLEMVTSASELFQRSTEKALEMSFSSLLYTSWEQKDCNCAVIDGKPVRIIESSPSMLLLETGHRFWRYGRGFEIEFHAQVAMRVECMQPLSLNWIHAEEREVRALLRFDPEKLNSVSSTTSLPGSSLQVGRRLLCGEVF